MSTLSSPEVLALLKRNLPIEDQRSEIIEEIGASHLRMRLPVVPEYLRAVGRKSVALSAICDRL